MMGPYFIASTLMQIAIFNGVYYGACIVYNGACVVYNGSCVVYNGAKFVKKLIKSKDTKEKLD